MQNALELECSLCFKIRTAEHVAKAAIKLRYAAIREAVDTLSKRHSYDFPQLPVMTEGFTFRADCIFEFFRTFIEHLH